jgi:hypothetical protein
MDMEILLSTKTQSVLLVVIKGQAQYKGTLKKKEYATTGL